MNKWWLCRNSDCSVVLRACNWYWNELGPKVQQRILSRSISNSVTCWNAAEVYIHPGMTWPVHCNGDVHEFNEQQIGVPYSILVSHTKFNYLNLFLLVVTSLNLKRQFLYFSNAVFCDVTPYTVVGIYQCCGGTSCTEVRDTWFLQTLCWSRWRVNAEDASSESIWWEPQISYCLSYMWIMLRVSFLWGLCFLNICNGLIQLSDQQSSFGRSCPACICSWGFPSFDPGECWDGAWNWIMAPSMHMHSNSLFSNNPAILTVIIWGGGSIVD